MSCNNDDEVLEVTGSAPCNSPTCVNPVASSCTAVCSCGCNPCTCGSSVAPYYNQAQACQESHVQVYSNTVYSAVVTTSKAFNMPACGSSITVVLPGVQKLQVGSYLWNAVYGYLQVMSFDFTTGEAALLNNCHINNAPAGNQVPACTEFNVVDPPYVPENNCGEGIYVTEDFVVPGIGSSVTISVSGIEGLLILGNVQVGTGIYTLLDILSNNSIIIENTAGTAPAPGTVIYAYDSQGNCISPVTPYIPNPCAASALSTGVLLVCDRNSVYPLDATAVGQVPVCVDADTNEVEFQSLDIPIIICTTITACVNLVSGTDTYNVQVDDSSEFTVGEVVIIQDPTVENLLWVITLVPDGTHITITIIDGPVAIDYTVLADTQLCHGSCCQQVEYRLDDVCSQDWSAAQDSHGFSTTASTESGSLDPGDPEFKTTSRTVTITNPTCNEMKVMINMHYFLYGTLNTSENSWARVNMKPYMGVTTAVLPAAPSVPSLSELLTVPNDITVGIGPNVCNAFNAHFSTQWHDTRVYTINAGECMRIDVQLGFNYVNYKKGSESCCPCGSLLTEGTGVFTIVEAFARIHALGIAVNV